MRKELIITAGLILMLIISGIMHGRTFDRFGPSESIEKMVDSVKLLPKDFEKWEGQEITNDDPADMLRNGIKAYSHRRYIHRESGQIIEFLLVSGLTGPISVHTPDVCYTNSGYEQSGKVTPKIVSHPDGKQSAYNVARFQKRTDGITDTLEIGWCWATKDGKWVAPDSPRMAFSRYRGLYKLYAIRLLPPIPSESTVNPVQDFFRDVLPQMNPILFQQPNS